MLALVFLVTCIVFAYAVDSMVLYRVIWRVGRVTDEHLNARDLFKLCKLLVEDRLYRLSARFTLKKSSLKASEKRVSAKTASSSERAKLA